MIIECYRKGQTAKPSRPMFLVKKKVEFKVNHSSIFQNKTQVIIHLFLSFLIIYKLTHKKVQGTLFWFDSPPLDDGFVVSIDIPFVSFITKTINIAPTKQPMANIIKQLSNPICSTSTGKNFDDVNKNKAITIEMIVKPVDRSCRGM